MGLIFYNIFLFIYSGAIRLASLWNSKAKNWVQGRKQFPTFYNNGSQQLVWMHCASLGEFEQGRPVLEALRSDPDFVAMNFKILVSFFSPSGYEIMKDYKYADAVIYLPMDSPSNARKLIEQINPSVVLWVKYEFWYHYLTELKRKDIPVLLLSGIFRDSQPFFKWYGSLWRKMLNDFSIVFVQNKESAAILKSIKPLPEIIISGDTRFDRVIAIAEQKNVFDAIEKFIGNDKVIVAGSTWEEDEAEWVHFAKASPHIKLIIAPHEIDKENLKDVQHSFPGSIFYSELLHSSPDQNKSNILIIDNVGMLSKLYRYAHIAYVGGGFGSEGVHNVLEAAVYFTCVLHGPEYDKYAEAVDLVKCGGSIVINSAVELEKIVTDLFANENLLKKHGQAAGSYVHAHVGATKIVVDYIYEKRLLTN